MVAVGTRYLLEKFREGWHLHSHTSYRTRFTCRRRQYHYSRDVGQFVMPLLQTFQQGLMSGGGTLPMDTGVVTSSTDSMVNALGCFLHAAEGMPPTLQHEGPLSKSQLQSLREYLPEEVLQALMSQLLNGELVTENNEVTASLWPIDVMRRYISCLFQARLEQIQRTREEAAELRFKAGLCARRVFCESDPSSVVDVATSTAHGKWEALIDRYALCLPDRSHVHELENLPQEIAIGELLADCIQEISLSSPSEPPFRLQCVVDVGGGNGFLAAQVGERLGCDSVVIDPFVPGSAIDRTERGNGEYKGYLSSNQTQAHRLRRVQALVSDVTWADALGSSATPNESAVIAKHLCGSAIDVCLRHLDAQNCLPRVFILAPCCYNKVEYEAYCLPSFLAEEIFIHDQTALARITRLTDWNASCYSLIREAERLSKRGYLPRGVEVDVLLSDTCISAPLIAGHASESSIAYQIPCMQALSQLVQSITNAGRVRWLQDRSYEVKVLQYVPNCVTPKNKCIVAVRH